MTSSPLPPDFPTVRETIEAYGLHTKKSLGQHFLTDLNITRKIVAQAGDLTGHTAIEIGPGPGALTRALLESEAENVIVVEKDDRCLPALEALQKASSKPLIILHQDALETDIAALSPHPKRIIANLPYNVGTPMIVQWLKLGTELASLTVMLQKEVVERIIAPPHSKHYGRLAVLSQIAATPRRDFDVPPTVFSPPPKVMSSVVTLEAYKMPLFDTNLETLEIITAAAFGQRRKMLRSSLKSLGGETLLEKAGIAPTKRAEELSLEEFASLAKSYQD